MQCAFFLGGPLRTNMYIRLSRFTLLYFFVQPLHTLSLAISSGLQIMACIQDFEGMQYSRTGDESEQLDYAFFNQQYASST